MKARHAASSGPSIAVIHPMAVAMEPIKAASERDRPEAPPANIFDDDLSGDRAADEALPPALTNRIVVLARQGRSTGPGSILFACSTLEPAIEPDPAPRRPRGRRKTYHPDHLILQQYNIAYTTISRNSIY